MGTKALPLAHLPSAPSYGLWGGVGASYRRRLESSGQRPLANITRER